MGWQTLRLSEVCQPPVMNQIGAPETHTYPEVVSRRIENRRYIAIQWLTTVRSRKSLKMGAIEPE
jgi:hypothetical protein